MVEGFKGLKFKGLAATRVCVAVMLSGLSIVLFVVGENIFRAIIRYHKLGRSSGLRACGASFQVLWSF